MHVFNTDPNYKDILSNFVVKIKDPLNVNTINTPHETIVNKAFKRNDTVSLINNHVFNNSEIDKLLMSQKPLYYFSKYDKTKKTAVITNYDLSIIIISKPKTKEQKNLINVKYIVNKKDRKMQSKIVGTTFRFQEQGAITFDDIAGAKKTTENGVPVKVGQALLLPEPENKYDPHAVKVIAKLANGKTYDLGFLPKNSQAALAVTKPIIAKLLAYGYSTVGSYNDSYAVEF